RHPLSLVPDPRRPPRRPYTPLFRSQSFADEEAVVRIEEKTDRIGGTQQAVGERLDDAQVQQSKEGQLASRCFARTGEQSFEIHAERKSTRLNSSHVSSSYAVLCLKR